MGKTTKAVKPKYHVILTSHRNNQIYYLDPKGQQWLGNPLNAGRFRECEAEWLLGIKTDILRGKPVTLTILQVPYRGYQNTWTRYLRK